MSNNTKRIAMLLLTFALLFSALPSVFASEEAAKQTYEVKYASEDLSTPLDWYNSNYFNNPEYKENRFVQYWWETPLEPGGTRDTGLYIVYNEQGVQIFFQSNEPERDNNGVLKNSSIEFFIQTGREGVPYHQMIIPTNGGPIEYYEWQTEYRHNRPLKGNVTVVNEEIPTGWGTVVSIPWEVYYEYVPLDGEDWEFSMIRWAPSNYSPTLGGKVHQVGRFNVLDFQAPTAAQRTAIQTNMISKAWEKFNQQAADLEEAWLNGNPDDAMFFNTHILPLIEQGEANGSLIPNLNSLSPAQIEELYEHVDSWMQLRYDSEDARKGYIEDWLFSESESPIETPNALTMTGSDDVIAGQAFDVTASVVNLENEFVTLDVVVNYDPEKLEFALDGAEGSEVLAESAFESLRSNFSLLGSAVKPDEGEIRLIMMSSGEQYAIDDDGPLFKLKGMVKAGTGVGGTTVSLTDAEVSFDGVSTVLDTALAKYEIGITLADKAILESAIANAQSIHDAATEGAAPGQYPAGSKATLDAAIQSAIIVRDSGSATQAQINEAVNTLTAAVAAFEASAIPGDSTALDAAIAAAENMLARAVEGDKLGQYEAGSKAVLSAAIEAARGAGPSQSEIAQATAALQAAMNTFAAKIITMIEGETKITIKDLSIIAKYYGMTSEDEGWSEIAKADVLGVNVIDVRNLAAVAKMILNDWRLN